MVKQPSTIELHTPLVNLKHVCPHQLRGVIFQLLDF